MEPKKNWVLGLSFGFRPKPRLKTQKPKNKEKNPNPKPKNPTYLGFLFTDKVNNIRLYSLFVIFFILIISLCVFNHHLVCLSFGVCLNSLGT